MLTRFAPTPSGYLHVGNLVNAALVNAVARYGSGTTLLRIDDADTQRTRTEYLHDIFRAVHWLPMQIDVGPTTFEGFPEWSQTRRRETYWQTLRDLESSNAPLFVCRCTRTEVVDGRCVRGCHGLLDDFDSHANSHVVRLRSQNEDTVLWGRFGPAYHLCSVSDDITFGVTHVVRGKDLEASTIIHRRLAQFLDAPGIRYAHHDLVVSEQGTKLSKSQGTDFLEFTDELREHVLARAHELLPQVLQQFDN